MDAIAVVEREPRIYYVGYATGGVWKTENAGTTFEPVFEEYGSHSIGALAVDQRNPDVVWVGTGEGNGRNNSAFGDGVYKSTDGGRTFRNVGLGETQTIEVIVIDPRDSDVVYVAAVGHLYGPNPERGLYKTTDGGTTWARVLFVDDDTGVIDVVLDPSDPDVVYAASYQRRRTSWGFNGGGPGSGIWKSADGGANWQRLTGNGLPGGPQGRIGLAVAPSSPNVVYAQIEVLRDEDRAADPSQATTSTRPEPGTDQAGGVWRSGDAGATWEFRSDHNVRPQYYSNLRVDPRNPEVVYTTGRRFYRTEDGASTFHQVPGLGHSDHHAIWINPEDGNHLLVGTDGGLDVTHDRGRTWKSFRTSPVGQFAGLSVDMQRPYYVYGGLQDNGSWAGPSRTRGEFISAHEWFSIGGGDGAWTASDPLGRTIYSEGQRGRIQRLDMSTGRIAQIQPQPPATPGAPSNVVPAPSHEDEFRWNWAAPFIVSTEGSDVLYLGGNRLFKTTDRGETWTMSPDLTGQVNTDELSIMGMKGDLPYCHGSRARIARGQECILSKSDGTWFYSTIYTVAESSLPHGPLWVGTDDGNVQVSRNGGETWTDVTGNLSGAPRNCYITRVEASHFDDATAYVAVNCRRGDDHSPHLFVTRDYGATWASVAAGLPAGHSVNVIRQDRTNPALLFVGTELGFFVSLDEGSSWKPLMTGLATVRVDEVIVHPRESDLVIGTYGRSVLIMDDITPLQQLTPEILARDAHLFGPREAVLWKRDARTARSLPGAQQFKGENPPPGTAIHYYLKRATGGPVTVRIADARTGAVVRELQGPGDPGINRVQWDLRGTSDGGASGPPVESGTYRVILRVSGEEHSALVRVVEDRWTGGQQ